MIRPADNRAQVTLAVLLLRNNQGFVNAIQRITHRGTIAKYRSARVHVRMFWAQMIGIMPINGVAPTLLCRRRHIPL
jgi:hypothetical protein